MVWAILFFLAAIAALTRILTLKGAPDYFKNFFAGLSNLYKGVYSQ